MERPTQQEWPPSEGDHTIRRLERRGDTFQDLMRRVDHEMDDLESRLNRIFLETRVDLDHGLPILGGWSLSPRSGTHRVQRFGSYISSPGHLTEGWRHPLITSEIDEEEGQVWITAEVPGVRKEDLEVVITPEHVRIGAETDEHRFRGTHHFAHAIDPESAEARHEHGVLRIVARIQAVQVTMERRLPVR